MLCFAGAARAAQTQDEFKWSLSPLLGVHSPSLKLLSEGVFKSPFAGVSAVQVDNAAQQKNFVFDNPLPELGLGTYAGFEFQWLMDDTLAWVAGLGMWEASAASSSDGTLPLQQEISETKGYRTARISYNEAFVGMRYTVWDRPSKYRVYLRGSLNNVFDIDYREDYIFRFSTGAAAGFNRSLFIDASSTAVLLLQAGVGADWYVTDWLSIGGEAGFTLGTRDFYLRSPKVRTDIRDRVIDPESGLLITPGDGFVRIRLPLAPDREGRLRYLDEEGGGHDMPLSLNGWKAMLRISIYY